MSTATASSTAAPAEFEVDFPLPDDFREILSGASPEEARAAVAQRFGPEVLATLPAAALESAVGEYLAASAGLEQADVFYAAGFLGLIGAEVTLSSLTVSRIVVDCRDPEAAVDGIVRIRGRGQGSQHRLAQRYELPCGPAALVFESAVGLVLPAEALAATELRTADLAAAGIDTTADLPLPVATLQAFIPVPPAADPARRTMAVVTFCTPSTQHWETYCPVLVDLLRGFRFPAAEAPGATGFAAPAPAAAPERTAGRSSIRDALG